MTAAVPNAPLRGLASAPRLVPPAPPEAESGDRNFVTLLALNFMLLAFFVVLGTASSFDQPRVASIARSVRVSFAAPQVVAKNTSAVRLTGRHALQAGVSNAFASVLPIVNRVVREDGDRVDVVLATNVAATAGPEAMEELVDAIATLMRSAPAEVHYQLMVEGGADVPAMATSLLARGVAPGQLMTAAESDGAHALRFSFLLLEGDEDSPFARLMPEEKR